MSRIRETVRATVLTMSFGVLLLTVGCRTDEPPQSPDTGSRLVVRAFYGNIIQRDWANAYDTLHADSRKACSVEAFTKNAQVYRQQLWFEPNAVHVRSCDEHGEEATAHVVLTGPGNKRHQYKDAIVLRRLEGKWWIVLPAAFKGRV